MDYAARDWLDGCRDRFRGTGVFLQDCVDYVNVVSICSAWTGCRMNESVRLFR